MTGRTNMIISGITVTPKKLPQFLCEKGFLFYFPVKNIYQLFWFGDTQVALRFVCLVVGFFANYRVGGKVMAVVG